MARIFDNIEQDLLTALRATLAVSDRADFCVGYLNLRGWQAVDDLIQPWTVDAGQVCRVLVGMQRPPHDEIREIYRAGSGEDGLDNADAARLKSQFAALLCQEEGRGLRPARTVPFADRSARAQVRAGCTSCVPPVFFGSFRARLCGSSHPPTVSRRTVWLRR